MSTPKLLLYQNTLVLRKWETKHIKATNNFKWSNSQKLKVEKKSDH